MLRIIFWTVVIVVFLSFFGISVQGLFENPTTQSNFEFLLGLVEEGWDTLWAAITALVESLTDAFARILPS